MSERPTPRTDWANSTSAANLEARYDRMHDLAEELEREKRRAEENGVLAHDLGIRLAEAREEIAALRSDEQRLIAFSKRDRKRADDLSDKLAQVVCERDRLAQVIEAATVLDRRALTGDLVGFDSEAMTLTLKMQQMPAAATLGERVVLRLPNVNVLAPAGEKTPTNKTDV